MGIVERAAKLLGPSGTPDSARDGAGEKESSQPEGVIERRFGQRSGLQRAYPDTHSFLSQIEAVEQAVIENGSLYGLNEPKGFGPDGEVSEPATERQAEPGPAVTRNKGARIHRIDLDRLQSHQLLTTSGERNATSESFRRIKRQVLARASSTLHADEAPSNLVLVTSALKGEGKTYCAINLAISIALEIDRTALLVDGDVANPGIPQALGLSAELGLMDVLSDPQIDLDNVLWHTNIGKLALLPAGAAKQHSTEFLASDATGVMLHEMARRYPDRIVIFDSPPLLAASEADALARHMGQIIVIVEAGRTSETALKAALAHIDHAKITGLLLNKAQFSSESYDYGG